MKVLNARIERAKGEYYCRVDIERRETGRFAVKITKGRDTMIYGEKTMVVGRGNDLDEAVKEARDLAAETPEHPADHLVSSLLSMAAYEMEIELEETSAPAVDATEAESAP